MRPTREHRVFPYLLGDASAAYPNDVWGIEEVYLADYDSPRAAHRGLTRYFEFYTHWRPHQALAYRAPAEVYFASLMPGLLLTTTTKPN